MEDKAQAAILKYEEKIKGTVAHIENLKSKKDSIDKKIVQCEGVIAQCLSKIDALKKA